MRTVKSILQWIIARLPKEPGEPDSTRSVAPEVRPGDRRQCGDLQVMRPAPVDEELPEVPVKLCRECGTAYRMVAWQKLPLLAASTERTRSKKLPKTETRTCQCGKKLVLDFQHYEDFDYRVSPRSKYDRAYGL